MAKTKELSKDTRDCEQDWNESIYRRKQLDEKRSTVVAVNRKWKKHKISDNLPPSVAPCKISHVVVQMI